jgi:hypothetical protein
MAMVATVLMAMVAIPVMVGVAIPATAMRPMVHRSLRLHPQHRLHLQQASNSQYVGTYTGMCTCAGNLTTSVV